MNYGIVKVSLLTIYLFASALPTDNIKEYLSDFKSGYSETRYDAINSFFMKYDTNAVNILISKFKTSGDSLKPFIIDAIGILQDPKACFFLESEQENSGNYIIREVSEKALINIKSFDPLYYVSFYGSHFDIKPKTIPVKSYGQFKRKQAVSITFGLSSLGLLTYSVFGTGFMIYKRMKDEEYYHDKKKVMWTSIGSSLGAGLLTLGVSIKFQRSSYKGVIKRYNPYQKRKENLLKSINTDIINSWSEEDGIHKLLHVYLYNNYDSANVKAAQNIIANLNSDAHIEELFQVIANTKYFLTDNLYPLFDLISDFNSPVVDKSLKSLFLTHPNQRIRVESAILLCKKGDLSVLNYLSSLFEKTDDIEIIARLLTGIIEIGVPATPVLIESFPKTTYSGDYSYKKLKSQSGVIRYSVIERRRAGASDTRYFPEIKNLQDIFGDYLTIDAVSGNYAHYKIGEAYDIIVNMYARYSIYWGAYLLNKITGNDLGPEKENWQKWWKELSKKDETSSNTISQKESIKETVNVNKTNTNFSENDLKLNSQTTIILNTGKEFVGILTEISSESYIIDVGGNSITFYKNAIKNISQ